MRSTGTVNGGYPSPSQGVNFLLHEHETKKSDDLGHLLVKYQKYVHFRCVFVSARVNLASN